MPHRDLILHSAHTSKELMRMPVGRPNPAPLWVDGSISLRVRDKRQRFWRMLKIRQPHAVVGRHQAADLVIDRPDVADHHVFLFLDSRGLFGVDLRTEGGTRFAGTIADACWLGSGDLIEVGEHVIEIVQLRVNGSVLTGPLADDDPLALVDSGGDQPRGELTLRPLHDRTTSWSVGSSLVFLGRGPACAVPLADASVGTTHSALLRVGMVAYLIQFPGETALLNNHPTPSAVRLADGDVLTIGADSLLIQTHDLGFDSLAGPAVFADLTSRLAVAVGNNNRPDVESSFGHHPVPDGNPVDYPSLLGRLQAETAAIIGVLLRRIESLDEEMAELRDRLDTDDRNRAQRPAVPPVEPLRWDLIPRPDTEPNFSAESSSWLVNRLQQLEAERQTTWSSLVGRMNPARSADLPSDPS